MGKVFTIGKWDLENTCWTLSKIKDFGRSAAFAKYEKIINNNNLINYIIIANGSRVENHSKNYKTINEKQVGVDRVLDYFKKKNDNYDIQLFFMDADAPIIEDTKILAKYIDNLAILPTTGSINILGLSKCGVMSFYIPSFFKQQESFYKTNIFNIATPYEGTKLASPLIFYPEIKKVVFSKIKNERMAEVIYSKLVTFYEGISSNSHMDYDIAIPNGIPISKFKVYDEKLIQNIFSSKNIEAIQRINSFKNFVTGIDKNTLREAVKTMNFTGIGLCILDDIFFENRSDGMVYVNSQKIVENRLDNTSIVLKSAHHDVNSNVRVFNDILSSVNDTIEYGNPKIYKKRKN